MSIERELAVHETEIKHMQADMDRLVQDMEDLKKNIKEIENTLNSINTTLAEARGGWRVLMMLGGAGGVLGSALTYVVNQWLGK